MQYLFLEKTVIDETNLIVFTISQFKAEINKKIKDEQLHQKTMNRHINEAGNLPSFNASEATKGFCLASLEASTLRIKKLQNLLKRCAFRKETDNKLDVEGAKLTPISDFVTFDRGGFSPCLWHNEHTASMKYYPEDNHVHCFGCQKNGDVIDVIQILYNLDFIRAVKYILN